MRGACVLCTHRPRCALRLGGRRERDVDRGVDVAASLRKRRFRSWAREAHATQLWKAHTKTSERHSWPCAPSRLGRGREREAGKGKGKGGVGCEWVTAADLLDVCLGHRVWRCVRG
jgi:hypothetical protein